MSEKARAIVLLMLDRGSADSKRGCKLLQHRVLRDVASNVCGVLDPGGMPCACAQHISVYLALGGHTMWQHE